LLGDLRHPSLGIIGLESRSLWGRCVALGVTGSAAAYKSIDMARTLMRWGALVRVVMTRHAASLVSPTLFEWATGMPVTVEFTGGIEHVSLARECDALLVAPATLDTLSDIAYYRAGDVVSALSQEMLGLGKPVLAIPAMHLGMWRRALGLVRRLEDIGVFILKPRLEGEQAKYPDTMLAAWWSEAVISRGMDLKGLRIMVTAGPTREYIDSVRVITNPSTGLMGVSIALEAAWRGAEVTLVHGPLSCCSWSAWKSYLANIVEVTTTCEMADAVAHASRRGYEAGFYAAAVSDYAPASKLEGKLPTEEGPVTLELKPTPKVIETAISMLPEALHVGFTAEPLTGDRLLARAREKLERYQLDAIAANSTIERGAGFGYETNHVFLLDWRGRLLEIKGHKRLVARHILDHALRMIARREVRAASRARGA